MAWYPNAVQKPINRPKHAMRAPRRINLHTAVSDTKSLQGYWNSNKLGVFSHFYVREDGTVEQYQDTQYRSACDLQGNPDTISIESWDGYGRVWTGQAGASKPGPWNPAQVKALIALVGWIFATHPTIPRKLATSNKKGHESFGLSYHQLGSPGLMKYSTGLKYTNARGKVCPGAQRIAQIPAIFHAASTPAPPSGGAGTITPTAPEEDIMATAKEAASAFFNEKFTANGVKKSFIDHMAGAWVDDKAQSKALAVLADRQAETNKKLDQMIVLLRQAVTK